MTATAAIRARGAPQPRVWSESLAIRAALRPGAHLIPAILVLYSCLLPRELAFEVGGIEFGPTRIVSLLSLPLMLIISRRQSIRFSPIDLVAIYLFLWYPIAAYAVDGLPTLLNRGIAVSIDLGLIYFIGRVSMQSHDDFRKLLILILPGAFVAGLLVMMESVASEHMVRPFITGILGKPSPAIEIYYRIGLMRGVGPFFHPILAGLFLASMVPLVWGSLRDLPRIRMLGFLTGALSFFALSSGPLLALMISIGSIATLLLQRRMRLPFVAIAAGTAVVGFIALEAVSQNGALNVIIRYLTFSSASARYRTFIWEYGSIEVMNNPLFGIGERDWIRPGWMVLDTVDAYWLYLAMFYGLPATIMCLILAISTMIALGRSATLLPISPARDMHNGILITIGAFIFIGFTVHLWDSAVVLFLLLIASGVSLSQVAREKAQQWRLHGAPRIPPRSPHRPARWASARVQAPIIPRNRRDT